MSNEGNRAAVFRTTKVRTKLKGDGSWLQRRNDQTETEEEKPWVAEVRASRLNGTPIESSPVSSPTKSTPPPTKQDTERAPASGFLIRGIFTKLDDKPASPSTSNDFSGATQFSKKPSESYKRIAPHTVRPTPENREGQLSHEEQEKRTEAASSVLKKSAARQRSYVLSAAKKYESKEKAPDTSLVSSSQSFVAKRVEIIDDDESTTTPAPASSPPPSPAVPATSVASAPAPKPRQLVKTAVDVAAGKPVEKTAPEPVEEDPFEDMKPGCTKVATPLPELIPVCVEAVCTEPERDDSEVSGQDDTPLVEPTPALSTPVSTPPPSSALAPTAPDSPAPESPVSESPAPVSPTPPSLVSPVSESPAPVSPTPPSLVSPVSESPAPVSPTPEPPSPVSPVPESTVPVSAVTAIAVKTELKPEPDHEEEPESEPEPEPESKLSPKPSSSVGTLTAFYDTLISFDTSSTSFKDNEPELAKQEGGSANSHTTENGVEREPAPALSNCGPITEDLLALNDGPEESAQPVPPSPGRWSQDLLNGLDSLSEQREEEKQTDETAEETQSPPETVTITSKTMIITDKSEEDNADPWSSRGTTTVTESSSTDPFDPYPIGTTSLNSSSDLLQPLADISINSAPTTSMENKDPSPEINMSSKALKSLSDDVIPINTDSTSLSTQRQWAHTWESSVPQPTNTEESQEPEMEGQAEDQQMLIMFERKSNENDSPWDRWTSPTVYTITTTTGEEEEEEEEQSPEDTQTETDTDVATIREIRSEPDPAMDRSVIEDDHRVQTTEPETKKGFVYVKEYVNATETSSYNPRDTCNSGSSNSYSYSSSSPSTYSSGSLSSTCTYCGQQVGNDAKITIEHLNINCHPTCFKCGVCSKPMGDLLYSMFLHGGKVHCESCYSKAFD